MAGEGRPSPATCKQEGNKKGEATHMPVRLVMPSLMSPFGELELRQLAGIVPVSRLALALRVFNALSRDHSGGNTPLRVLLLRSMLRRLGFEAHDAGIEPVQAT